jgi:hypothetical protein
MARRMAEVNKEKDLWVHSFRMPPDSNNSIKMEVGIEDCLHIEFEYNKSKYDHHRSVRQFGILTIGQIPSKGCYRWEDLLSAGPDKDQAHGALHYPSRDDRSPAEPIQ